MALFFYKKCEIYEINGLPRVLWRYVSAVVALVGRFIRCAPMCPTEVWLHAGGCGARSGRRGSGMRDVVIIDCGVDILYDGLCFAELP